MKITAVTDHAGLFARLKLGFITLMMGGPKDVADIVRLLLYRPAFFGSSFNHYCQTLLRGPSDWTVGERELIGTWVSQTNECRFCTSIHREVAVRSLPGGAAVVDAALRDPNSAGLSPQMTALLPFLRKLTRTPGEVTPQDARSVLASLF